MCKKKINKTIVFNLFTRRTRGGEDNVKRKCQLFLERVTTALDKDIRALLYNNITPRRVAARQAKHTI